MLFQLLVAILDRIETQTLLHVSRLAAGLDWPLRVLLAEVQRRRAISPLEHGALAEGAPIGAWVTRARAAPADAAPEADPPPLDPDEQSRRPPGARCGHRPRSVAYEARRGAGAHGPQLVTGDPERGGRAAGRSWDRYGQEPGVPVAGGAAGGPRVSAGGRLDRHDHAAGSALRARLAAGAGGLRSEQPLRATRPEGRANYLCLRRWQMLLHAGDLSPADRMLLIKTLSGSRRTPTGDRAELHLSPAEQEAWNRLSAVTEACTPLRCRTTASGCASSRERAARPRRATS